MVTTRLALLLGLLGCPRAEVVDYCTEEDCPPCARDAECVFTGNACTDTVYCAHEDSEIAVVQIGCSKAQERRWPDPSACVCADTVCQSAD